MIIIKIIIAYFIQIRHTDDFPSTGTRLMLIITLTFYTIFLGKGGNFTLSGEHFCNTITFLTKININLYINLRMSRDFLCVCVCVCVSVCVRAASFTYVGEVLPVHINASSL